MSTYGNAHVVGLDSPHTIMQLGCVIWASPSISFLPHLQAMGALTKGDRRAADASDLSAFDYQNVHGSKALQDVMKECARASEDGGVAEYIRLGEKHADERAKPGEKTEKEKRSPHLPE